MKFWIPSSSILVAFKAVMLIGTLRMFSSRLSAVTMISSVMRVTDSLGGLSGRGYGDECGCECRGNAIK